MRKRKTSFTKKEDKFIKDNYLKMPIKAIGTHLGRSYTGIMSRLKTYGLTIPKELREQRKRATSFQKGNIPFNKGLKLEDYMPDESIRKFKAAQFKKGNKPHNTRKIGDISIRKENSTDIYYKYIKLADNNWELLSRYNYKKHIGPIPPWQIVTYKDGDSLNCEPTNLYLITKQQNMKNNTIHQYPAELQKTIRLTNKIKNYDTK